MRFPFFLSVPPPPCSTLFPYTTLFRSLLDVEVETLGLAPRDGRGNANFHFRPEFAERLLPGTPGVTDRKSTRLNSSHTVISYAVFCLKKKNQQAQTSS